MMVEEPKRGSLRALSGRPISPDDWEEVIAEVHQTSDRTAAIVLASWVERDLEQSIIKALPKNDDQTASKLLERDGALHSFYSKTYLGFALGLYDQSTVENLDCIRKIRNAFAHAALPIHFETQQIIDEVNKLHVTTRPTPEAMMKFSEYRRKFELACLRFVTRH
jgi:DNA-binding MltR family transcriptional regulator